MAASSIALPSDPDGDPITIKVVSLPPELSNPSSGDVRFDLFVDEGGTKVPLHAGDVLTTDQLQNSLFSWVANPPAARRRSATWSIRSPIRICIRCRASYVSA